VAVLNALTYFPLKEKGKFPCAISLVFLSPEDFRDAFFVAGDASGRPWLLWIRGLTRYTQDFTIKGAHVVGHGQGSGDVSLSVGSRGRAPMGVLDAGPRS